MFASSPGPRARRRGIVLVLVLGMLGLLALIGVTFATFAGQSLINSRNFNQGVARPQPEALMDYALAQLINDTNNPLSALRGHSILRDMYGNDSHFRGSNPAANPAAETGGLLTSVYNGGTSPVNLVFTGVQQHSTTNPTPFFNQLQYSTNIPTSGQYYGLDFTRWIVRFGLVSGTLAVPQTFEVLEDDATGSVHVFTLSNSLASPTLDPTYIGASTPPTSASDWTSFIYADPNFAPVVGPGPPTFQKNYTQLAREQNIANATLSTTNTSNAFVLDGRYMRAFNGPGLTRFNATAYPFNLAAFANFRLNGLDPDAIGMDEDYDACDLENWFLAIQSADGQVVIPSFHRPGILSATDWTTNPGGGNAKILRPRQVDHSPLFPADPSTLDSNGKLTYDIDNDGDGVTDSVWLDLGYPVQRDPNGKIYKPLFAFMVLGLNGRMPLNTVGNLQARAIGDITHNNDLATPLPASTGQVPYPGPGGDGTYYHPNYSSQTYLDAPLWDHASHLGFSVNEINPKFALQNAPSNVYPSAPPTGNVLPNANGTNFAQSDNVGVSVALTQLRKILAGTIPTDIQNPVAASSLPVNTTSTSANQDVNVLTVDGQTWVLPNDVADNLDIRTGGVAGVARTLPAVPGRWGESEGIPRFLPDPSNSTWLSTLTYPPYWYNNTVRAGRSFYNGIADPTYLGTVTGTAPGTGHPTTNDAVDDDFDSTDPYLGPVIAPVFTIAQNLGTTPTGDIYTLPLALTGASSTSYTFPRQYPEFVDFIDNAGQHGIASERMRRYSTPQDPAGVGRVVSFMGRPAGDYDYGRGADDHGRSSFFRYFRPAGMPQEVRYPYLATGGQSFPYYPYTSASGTGQQYLMPLLFPAGYANPAATGPISIADISTNRLRGYQSMLTPNVTAAAKEQVIASMSAMLFDWDPTISGTGSAPAGYPATITFQAPMINPNKPVTTLPTMPSDQTNPNFPLYTSTSTGDGPNLGKIGDFNAGGTYPIKYAQYDNANYYTFVAPVVNGYLGGSLNKDEADEMNLYTTNRADMPYGPSDLEWLYRKQDVDGATLGSRLAKLAPVSFTNPADGLTRRRLFSTDVWDLNTFSYANDNPLPYAGAAYHTTINSVNYSLANDHDYNYNSRFAVNASPSLENMNQVPAVFAANVNDQADPFYHFANYITTEFLPNPTLPQQASFPLNPGPYTQYGNTIGGYIPNSSFIGSPQTLPLQIDPTQPSNLFGASRVTNAVAQNNLIIPSGGKSGNIPLSMTQVQTPSVAHRDRKINLNAPLPISNDPAEPVRQKWCRETYQMLKAILPPASIDTPEELAALSQYVVNILDFRDSDGTMTRFVNTDLVVTDVLTHSAKNILLDPFERQWTVSPSGVKFADQPISDPHFPYDPSLYSPDAVTPFLVQHGMEYNPIVINEAMAYQALGGTGTGAAPQTYQALFIELINTLTADQNNSSTVPIPGNDTPIVANASTIILKGWDIIIAPDAAGWGRPDPITGDVNPIAWPPLTTGVGTNPPVTNNPGSQRPHSQTPTDSTNINQLQTAVQQYSFTYGRLLPITGSTTTHPYIVGDYRVAGVSVAGNTVEVLPVATPLEGQLPTAFQFPDYPAGSARYYWVYLRRPANPFDDSVPTQANPNKEMVVVDCMRFPVIDSGTTFVPGTALTPPTVTLANQIFSAQRLQPNRGGHLIPRNSPPDIVKYTQLPVAGNPAFNATTISPPSPAYVYGYSEQIAPPPTGNGTGQFNYTTPNPGGRLITTYPLQQSINLANPGRDTNWSLLPFHDRDFTSVAELLLVPGCPPGLLTKQFVEETYPGNIFADTAMTTAAAGLDDNAFLAAPPGALRSATSTPPNSIVAPAGTTNPSLVGRKDFAATPTLPPNVTYPYLPDNFYYTAASVAPPNGGTLDNNYTRLTTEIGGWTGAGWHKMLEFFEVPSSANGAIGTADNGNNYDWYRADLKPGQVNLNLIIDEEVFAGIFDDPRLNEALAAASSTIPFVVSQIDGYGYPASDANGFVHGRSPIFNHPSVNLGGGGVAYPNSPFPPNFGRGYVYRDPNIDNYDQTLATYPNYQQVHGIKAAFSDFLKIRHGGSGYLFGFGAGPTGSGDFAAGPLTIATAGTPPLTQPIAAERPYRSLSYPDINYTILRPASLPPSLVDPNNNAATDPNGAQIVFPGTNPPLPSTPPQSLAGMLQYVADPNDVSPFVALNPTLAPMHESLMGAGARDFQYVQDPGIKNPYLAIQFVNKTSANNLPTTDRHLGPPYAVQPRSATAQPAPFPPPIPPTPARRLLQIPDVTSSATAGYTSNASLLGQVDIADHTAVNAAINASNVPTDAQYATEYTINQPTVNPMLSVLPGYTALATGTGAALSSQSSSQRAAQVILPYGTAPPSLVDQTRATFAADNYLPHPIAALNNFLGAGFTSTTSVVLTVPPAGSDLRQHPAFRTEWLQKIANLTTVRTHQFAVWLTVGFFEVVHTGTPELNIADTIGQELGLAAGKSVRYRSFFVLDRTKAAGFNPYYPGNFRDCVTYRRRIE